VEFSGEKRVANDPPRAVLGPDQAKPIEGGNLRLSEL